LLREVSGFHWTRQSEVPNDSLKAERRETILPLADPFGPGMKAVKFDFAIYSQSVSQSVSHIPVIPTEGSCAFSATSWTVVLQVKSRSIPSKFSAPHYTLIALPFDDTESEVVTAS
jgi:hypothetical protein